jgi:putative hydrolase of the HAD superfamily
MMRYQHYSFDLWLTLIRSNPLFKQERTKYFHQHFNHQHKTIEEVAFIFRQVDLMVNAVNEKTGKNIDADEMYFMVISLLNEGMLLLPDINWIFLEEEMESLLFNHLPLVYGEETIKTLQEIRQNGESTISILSNTGFISGKTLRKVLKKLNLDSYFDFQLYSDEAGMSKPNPDFFKLMLDNVRAIRKTDDVFLDQVIHVGDNINADIKGAKSAGIHSLLVNSNNQQISSLIS